VRSEAHATPRSLSALGPASATFVAGGTLQQLFGGNQNSSVASVVAATGLAQVPEASPMSSFYFTERVWIASRGG
jgi:hypothetical protein